VVAVAALALAAMGSGCPERGASPDALMPPPRPTSLDLLVVRTQASDNALYDPKAASQVLRCMPNGSGRCMNSGSTTCRTAGSMSEAAPFCSHFT